MKIKYIIVLFSLIGIQACSSVTGPVHFYSGQPRPGTETARIQVPAPITIVKIDGKEVEVPSKEDGYYLVYLLPGLHRIDFKYELVWGDNESGMLIRSDIVGVETQFYKGMSYELTYSVPEGEEEAYEMARENEFKATLVESGTGRQVASRSIAELNEFRTSVVNQPASAVVALPKSRPEAVAKPGSVVTPAGIDADTATREDAVKRLKFWWLMANEAERERFRRWMRQVDNAEKQEVK